MLFPAYNYFPGPGIWKGSDKREGLHSFTPWFCLKRCLLEWNKETGQTRDKKDLGADVLRLGGDVCKSRWQPSNHGLQTHQDKWLTLVRVSPGLMPLTVLLPSQWVFFFFKIFDRVCYLVTGMRAIARRGEGKGKNKRSLQENSLCWTKWEKRIWLQRGGNK